MSFCTYLLPLRFQSTLVIFSLTKKTLVIVYATHFTAPKGEPGLLRFSPSKAGVMGCLWIKFNLQLLKLTPDKDRSENPILKNEEPEAQVGKVTSPTSHRRSRIP